MVKYGLLMRLADLIYWIAGYTCHQIPSRSLHFLGVQLPVCSRCTSIHAAIALAFAHVWNKKTYAHPFRLNWVLLAVFVAPTAVDGFTQYFGWRESSNFIRVVSGFPAGLAYAYFLTWLISHLDSVVRFLNSKIH